MLSAQGKDVLGLLRNEAKALKQLPPPAWHGPQGSASAGCAATAEPGQEPGHRGTDVRGQRKGAGRAGRLAQKFLQLTDFMVSGRGRQAGGGGRRRAQRPSPPFPQGPFAPAGLPVLGGVRCEAAVGKGREMVRFLLTP